MFASIFFARKSEPQEYCIPECEYVPCEVSTTEVPSLSDMIKHRDKLRGLLIDYRNKMITKEEYRAALQECGVNLALAED